MISRVVIIGPGDAKGVQIMTPSRILWFGSIRASLASALFSALSVDYLEYGALKQIQKYCVKSPSELSWAEV